MLKWSREGKWLVGGCTVALLLTAITSLISYQNAARLAETFDKVKRAHEVIESLLGLLATLNEAEAGRRGYILSGDKTELVRHQQAIQGFDAATQRLKPLIANHSDQRSRFAELTNLLTQRRVISRRSIETYQRGTARATQLALSTASNQNRDRIRQVVNAMQQQEEKTLQVWVEQSQASIQARMLIELLGTLLAVIILLSVFGLLYRQMNKRYAAETRELRLAQEKELGEIKLQFFSMTSHEFRTPLSIILGSAELLEETLQPIVEKSKLKNLYRIQTYAQLMTRLLSDILLLARAEAGRLEFQPEAIEMQSFCLNLVEDLQVLSEKQHPIRFTQQGDATQVRADAKLLYSILSNLLSNAIKYSPNGEAVDFTLIAQPEAITFRIKDQGIGMSPELQQGLFQPFQRGNNAKQILGTGLGLALVKKCLDLHRGELTIESQPNAGSCFTVTIPKSPTRSA